jgi:ABC-type proline/glycine betaine transport system permease subunit
MYNATLLTADTATHLKIVTIALVATMIAALVGICAQTGPERFDPPPRTTSQAVAPGN